MNHWIDTHELVMMKLFWWTFVFCVGLAALTAITEVVATACKVYRQALNHDEQFSALRDATVALKSLVVETAKSEATGHVDVLAALDTLQKTVNELGVAVGRIESQTAKIEELEKTVRADFQSVVNSFNLIVEKLNKIDAQQHQFASYFDREILKIAARLPKKITVRSAEHYKELTGKTCPDGVPKIAFVKFNKRKTRAKR